MPAKNTVHTPQPHYTPVHPHLKSIALLLCSTLLSTSLAHAIEAEPTPYIPTYASVPNPAVLNTPIPTDPALVRGQLSNGLQYLILRHTQPGRNVELRLVIKAGSINELEHERGISHFLEHMVFNGTRAYPGHQLIDTLENMGVQFGTDLNAYTGFDETTYILPIPLTHPKHFDKGLHLLEELAFNATLRTEDIDQERSVLMEEWRTSGLSATARQQEHNLKLTATGSRYANRMPIGSVDVIQHAPAQVLRDFYKRWYRPNLMSIVVVGDIDPQYAQQLIEQNFAKYTNPEQPQPSPSNLLPNNIEPLVGVFQDKGLPQSTVMLSNKDANNYIARNTTAGYLESLRISLMVTMINQRLQTLLETHGSTAPFLQAAADFDYVSGIVRSKQSLQWYAIAAPNKETETLASLNAEALRIKQFGFTQAELDRAIREHLTFLNNDSNNFQKATEYVRGIVENEPLPELAWERSTQAEFLPKITLNQVNALAQRIIQETNRIALINSNSPHRIDEEHVRALLAERPTLTPYMETTVRDTILASTPTPGQIVATQTQPDIGLTTWTLSNGIKVGFKHVPNNDGPVIFSGVAKGGYAQLNPQTLQQVRWGFDGLIEAGVNGLSKIQVGRVLAGKDLSVQLSVDESSQGIAGKFTAQDIEPAMQMIYSVLTGINRNPEHFTTFIQRNTLATQNLSSNREAQFEQAVQASLNRNNPRFTNVVPTPENWQNTRFDTTFDTYQSLFADNAQLKFIFVGNAQPERIKALVQTYLGALPSSINNSTNTSIPPLTPAARNPARLDYSPRTVRLSQGDEQLAEVRLMFGGTTTFNDTEQLALQALSHALNIRLIERLREQEGGVYSPYAYAVMGQEPTADYSLTLGFNCAPANIQSLIASTQEEIQSLVRNGIRPQDLQKFKLAEIASYTKRTSTNEFWVAGVRQNYLYGTPLAHLRNYPARIEALTAQDVQAAALKFISAQPVTAILTPNQ